MKVSSNIKETGEKNENYSSQNTYQIAAYNTRSYYRATFQLCNTFKWNILQLILFKNHVFKTLKTITSGSNLLRWTRYLWTENANVKEPYFMDSCVIQRRQQ